MRTVSKLLAILFSKNIKSYARHTTDMPELRISNKNNYINDINNKCKLSTSK